MAELRLAGATTIEEANVVLKDFLVRFNTRFGVVAQHPEVAYRRLEADVSLDRVLCFKHSRKVARDNTVKYRWRTLQLLPGLERTQLRRNGGRGLGRLGCSAGCAIPGRDHPQPGGARPILAYSEASTALPHTGQPLDSTSTVWAGAGRLPWQHSTPGSTPPMLATRSKKTVQPESAKWLPHHIGSPLHSRRQGGTLCRRAKRRGLSIRGVAREVGIHRDTAKKYMDAESPPMKRFATKTE